MTADSFLGEEGNLREVRLVENAMRMVRDGSNDMALQLRLKDVGERCRELPQRYFGVTT